MIDPIIERRAVDFLVSIRNQNDRNELRILDDALHRGQHFVEARPIFIFLLCEEIQNTNRDRAVRFG